MKSPIPKYLADFAPALYLEQFYPRSTQHRLRTITGLVMVSGTILYGAIPFFELPLNRTAILASTLLMAGLYVEQVLLGLYHNYYYFRGLDSRFGKGNHTPAPITYDAAKVLTSDVDDLTKAVLMSTFGQHIYVRCGITSVQIDAYLASNRSLITHAFITPPADTTITIVSIVELLLSQDESFVQFLLTTGTTADTFRAVSHLVMNAHYEYKRQERWWSRDSLSRRGSIGRELAYGTQHNKIPFTDRLVDDLKTTAEICDEAKQISHLESILASRADAHILMVAGEGNGAKHVLAHLENRMIRGTGLNALSGKHLVVMDTTSLTANSLSPAGTESALHALCQSAIAAGNVILVIPDMVKTTQAFLAKKVDLMGIIDEYLSDVPLHIIGIVQPQEHHDLTLLCSRFVKRSEEVCLTNPTETELVRFIGQEIFTVESNTNVFFTYPALLLIAEAAIRYETPTYETVLRLLRTIATKFPHTTITPTMVTSFLSETEGIALGQISVEEQHMLLHMEDILNARVVGQPRASAAIATSLRRSRVDIHDTTTPVLSLLFMGPSGVGKTEMAKVLAQVYRGSVNALVRFDMSEFAHEHLLTTMIDRLTTAITSSPHAIVLLDEFEKAHSTIQHLFLQILDEGMVTTSQGETVNFRNTIIIATSNAGSEIIARTSNQRAETPVLDSEVVEHIVTRGLLRRELLNRFSEVILFDSLSPESEHAIAIMLLAELTDRLGEKGYTLVVEPAVIEALVRNSHEPAYGARPLKHHIEKVIDDIVATRIIRGAVKPGDTITITLTDYQAQKPNLYTK